MVLFGFEVVYLLTELVLISAAAGRKSPNDVRKDRFKTKNWETHRVTCSLQRGSELVLVGPLGSDPDSATFGTFCTCWSFGNEIPEV